MGRGRPAALAEVGNSTDRVHVGVEEGERSYRRSKNRPILFKISSMLHIALTICHVLIRIFSCLCDIL